MSKKKHPQPPQPQADAPSTATVAETLNNEPTEPTAAIEPSAAPAETSQQPTATASVENPTQPGLKGVKLSRSRSFLAGALLRETGLDVGVTDEMVARIDQVYQGGTRANPVQTKFDLAGAWHVLKGYLEGKLDG
jgi:hypothetical protein